MARAAAARSGRGRAKVEASGVSPAAPRPEPEAAPAAFPIAAIGVPAGGVDAAAALLATLPAGLPLAIVIVQQKGAVRKGLRPRALQTATAMPVLRAAGGMPLEPGRVYLIPPGTQAAIHDRTFLLRADLPAAQPDFPVNHFFRALARDVHSAAIGVMLSADLADGVDGLMAIQSEGGVTLAQAQQSGALPASPEAVSGAIDLVLPFQAIAARIARLPAHAYFHAPGSPAAAPDPSSEAFANILRLLNQSPGSGPEPYHAAELLPPAGRRMALHNLDSTEEYLRLLAADPLEMRALQREILQSSRGFFRNPELFEALKPLLRKLVSAAPDSLRVWVPACSTGEEVYSLAMVLSEVAGNTPLKVRLFGTDVAEKAVQHARDGMYSGKSLRGVSSRRRARFFLQVPGGYQVQPALRKLCLFARHDFAGDPPFPQLDLIDFRHAPHSLPPAFEGKVIETFHWALKGGQGYLLLGGPGLSMLRPDLFAVVDAGHGIFRCRVSSALPAARPPVASEAEQVLLKRYAPAALVADGDLRVVRAFGNTGPFLAPRPAAAERYHLLNLVRPELLADVRKAVHKAHCQRSPVRRMGVRFRQDERQHTVDIEVLPLSGVGREDLLVVFRETAPPAPARSSPEAPLQAAAGRASPGEAGPQDAPGEWAGMLAEFSLVNEELLVSSRETEVARQEMRAANQELATLYTELQASNAQVARMTDLLAGVGIPIVILDRSLRILRLTPAAETVLRLLASDIGRPIDDLVPALDLPPWREVLSPVLERGQPEEREVQGRNGRWYLLRIQPYGARPQVDGIMIALVDIDALRRSLDIERASHQRAEELVRQETAIRESTAQPILMVEADGRIRRVNRAAERIFGYRREEMLGKTVEILLPELLGKGRGGRWPAGSCFASKGLRKDGREFPAEVTLPAIESFAGVCEVVFVSDLTERKAAEAALRDSRTQLALAQETAGIGLWDWDIRADRTLCSREWGPLYGLAPGASLNPEEWKAAIHPDDRSGVLESLRLAIEGVKPYETEFRVVWPDGAIHWLIGRGQVLRDPAGYPIRMLGVNMDITARRRSEEALRSSQEQLQDLTARLFAVQEDERSRLARELHDDFNQRMAMLANEVTLIEKELSPDSVARLRERLPSLRDKVNALSDDLRRVAHQLHPAALEYLGLAPALESYCAEFSRLSGIAVKFAHRSLPRPIPKEIGLCLYRIAQESLANIAKHSGAGEARLSLEGDRRSVRLEVSDNGKGFSPEDVPRRGLGLSSIRERIRLAGGRLTIDAGPGRGSRIEAELPMEGTGD